MENYSEITSHFRHQTAIRDIMDMRPWKVLNSIHMTYKAIPELVQYMLYISYHLSSYIVFCNTQHHKASLKCFFFNFLNTWSRKGMGIDWLFEVEMSRQGRDHQDLVINDQYANTKDVCCDVSYQHWQAPPKEYFWFYLSCLLYNIYKGLLILIISPVVGNNSYL